MPTFLLYTQERQNAGCRPSAQLPRERKRTNGVRSSGRGSDNAEQRPPTARLCSLQQPWGAISAQQSVPQTAHRRRGAREDGRRPHRPRAHHRRHGSARRTTPSRGGAVGQIQWVWSSAPLRSGTSTPIPSAGCATVHRLCVSWWLTTPLDSASSVARRLGHGCFDPQPVVVLPTLKPQPVVCRTTRDPHS
jgi:hypothetical protein